MINVSLAEPFYIDWDVKKSFCLSLSCCFLLVLNVLFFFPCCFTIRYEWQFLIELENITERPATRQDVCWFFKISTLLSFRKWFNHHKRSCGNPKALLVKDVLFGKVFVMVFISCSYLKALGKQHIGLNDFFFSILFHKTNRVFHIEHQMSVSCAQTIMHVFLVILLWAFFFYIYAKKLYYTVRIRFVLLSPQALMWTYPV